MNKHNLKVGQSIYIKFHRDYAGSASPRELTEHTVEKIGRVWAKLNHPYYRIELETLALDGGHGTAYLDPQHYKDAVELQRDWREFCVRIREIEHRRPINMTCETIKEARRVLGI